MKPVFSLVAAGALWLISGSAVEASFGASDLILPSVGSAPGVPPSVWYTTVWVYNPNPSNVQAEFRFLERNKANTSPLTVTDIIPAGDVRQYDDAVFTLFGVKSFGAIRVVAPARLVVSARIYSKASGESERNSKGQFFAGIPAAFAIGLGQSTDLLGATHTVPASSGDYRYNVGFVETAGATVNVRVTAVAETGSDWLTTTLTLQPFEQKQSSLTDLFQGVLGGAENFRIRCQVASGNGKVIAFASRIANGSQDPTTFEMTFRDELLGSGSSAVIHEATLTGDGTAASPLGIANGAVTPAKLSAAGSTSGQVLTSSGSTVSWQDPGGFTLPYNGFVAAADPAFSVTATTGSIAVRGLATSATQSAAYGGYFEANAPSAVGVYGLALGAAGRGVFGEASSSGVGVLGKSTGGDGVVGQAETAAKSGVYGVHANPSGYGIFGRNTATAAVGYLGGFNGVWGVTSQGLAHAGAFEASGNLAAGVYGKSTNAHGYGGVFEATGSSAIGLLAIGPSAGAPGLAAAFRGNVQVRSRSTEAVLIEFGEGLDYAEGFPTVPDESFGPGDVLVIAADGSGSLELAREPYDRRVAGIVAGGKGLGSAVRLAPGRFDHDVALAGRVYCNVDASYGAVRAGDLLTTSPTPGFAMVAADPARAVGAVLGKAMESLAAGERGQILVLVTLQ